MSEEITLKTVLEHMAAMEQRLSGRFGGVETRLGGVERRIESLDASLSRQIDGIDKRLDEIEIEQLPKRVALLETASAR